MHNAALHSFVRALALAMPPRRSARVAATLEERSCAFPQLPLSVELLIFSFLPADQRLRCAEVSRGWRATVAQPALWRHVDVSPKSGVAPRFLGLSPLLKVVLARAGDALTTLDVCRPDLEASSMLCAANAALDLGVGVSAAAAHSIGRFLDLDTCKALLAKMHAHLRELHVDLGCPHSEFGALLESRPPFAPLRLHTLHVLTLSRRGPAGWLTIPSALADANVQPDLTRLLLSGFELEAPDAVDALADAVCARKCLSSLGLAGCTFTHQAGAALARVLSAGKLTSLTLDGRGFDNAAVAVGVALLANSTLTSLTLGRSCVSATVLEALVGHRSIDTLRLCDLEQDCGAVLGTLVAADAPALKHLSLSPLDINEEVLGALSDALPHNSHLRELELGCGLRVDAAFTSNRLLPAMRANLSLRTLKIDIFCSSDPALEEAKRVVEAR